MDVMRLRAILSETTVQLRKGKPMERDANGATHLYFMPNESEVSDDLIKIDLHFIVIGVDKGAAERRKDELMDILGEYPQPERLAGGPSYIEVGGAIGDQGAALQLFALGEALDLWKVITPKVMGIEGPAADELAGKGMVMISGFKQEQEVIAS